MKISVITASYNRAATIGQAIESLQAQSHGDWEHVLQDGGSTDGTLDEIEKRPDPRQSLVSAPDAGIYDAINRGIARATGDVIGLMHSDDFFASERVLEKVADRLGPGNLDGVYGDLQYVSAADPDRVLRHWRAGAYAPERLGRGWMPPHPTLYLKRDVFARFGAYDTSYRIAADYEAMLRWLTEGRIRLGYIPEVMVRMRVGGESNRSLGRILRKSREDLRAIRQHRVGGVGTLILKNVSKLGQFAHKETRDR